MKIRPDAQRVEVYNEGLAVYLHDPENAGAILEANPASIVDVGELEPAKDKALKKLVEAGAIVTYYLRQDDPVVVDVVVGPPLSKAELKASGVPWLKPQQAVISLPSGRLRVDSPNTFRLSADSQLCAKTWQEKYGKPPADDNLAAFGLEDESGEAVVPPGDYVLTLHRVDFDKLDEDEEYDGPGEVITLTPASEAERPKRIPVVLEYGAGQSRVRGLRACKVQDGRFMGLALSSGITNMGWMHARKLGLRRGQRLRITHEGKPYEAVFLGGIEPRNAPDLFELIYPDKLAALHAREPELLTAGIHCSDILGVPLLYLQTLKPGLSLTADSDSPLTIEPTDDFPLPPPDALPAEPQGQVEGGVLRGEVLACGAPGVELSCDRRALRQLTKAESIRLVLRIGGTETPLLLMPQGQPGYRTYHIVHGHREDDDEYFGRIFSYMYKGGDSVFRACLGEPHATEIAALVKRYAAGCTFSPQEGYVPKDEAQAAEMRARCVRLWREGLAPLTAETALQAFLVPHWDDPKRSTLSCRPIAHPGVNPFTVRPGEPYEIRVM